jgi:hypothetical protein
MALDMSVVSEAVTNSLLAIGLAGVGVVGVDLARSAIFWVRMVIEPYDGSNPYHNGGKGDHWSYDPNDRDPDDDN